MCLTAGTFCFHGFSTQNMFQVFHADIFPILSRVPEIKCQLIDGTTTDIAKAWY